MGFQGMVAQQAMNTAPTNRYTFAQYFGVLFKVLAGCAERPACITGKCLKLAKKGDDPLGYFCGKLRLRPCSGLVCNRCIIVNASHPFTRSLYMTAKKECDFRIVEAILRQCYDVCTALLP